MNTKLELYKEQIFESIKNLGEKIPEEFKTQKKSIKEIEKEEMLKIENK